MMGKALNNNDEPWIYTVSPSVYSSMTKQDKDCIKDLDYTSMEVLK